MKFVVEIDLDNDALRDTREISRILREVANKVDAKTDTTKILDINGNSVGHFGLVK